MGCVPLHGVSESKNKNAERPKKNLSDDENFDGMNDLLLFSIKHVACAAPANRRKT